MAAVLKIGRVGLDVDLNAPSSADLAGDQLSLSGWFRVASVASVKVLRQQLTGYVGNPWEPVVPVQWSTDTSLNGYYSVNSAQVSMPIFGYRNGYATYDVSLTRVPNFTSGVTESNIYGAARSGTPGGITPSSWHATPSDAIGYDLSGVTAPVTRTGPGGTVDTFTDATKFYNAHPRYSLGVADWYDMAATITSGGFTVVGRQVDGVVSTWALTNGLLSVLPSGSSFTIAAPVFAAPSGYGTAYTFTPITSNLAGTIATSFANAISWSVLRNCPEESAIRITHESTTAAAPTRVFVDISLRRGSRFACVTLSSVQTDNYGLQGPASPTFATAVTANYSYRATSNDADANRLMICLGAGGVRTTDQRSLAINGLATIADLMVGLEVGGSGAAAPDRATDLRDQFFAASTETAAIVNP